MGGCLSKKKEPPSNDPPTQKKLEKEREKEDKNEILTSTSQPVEAPAAEKKTVFLITQNKKTPSSSQEGQSKKGETPKKKIQQDGERRDCGLVVEEVLPAAVRTSSCTKEELDAILIQCGRLSRSSSGKASNEASGVRKYSGSKRSYDFDEERRRGDEEEWEKPVSRSSPHRRTRSRERDGGGEHKRSGSREKGSGSGGRRVSRSPGRRSDGPASSNSATDRSKQPAKMVSVPAREKGGTNALEKNGVGVKRAMTSVSKPRSQSPRSQSPGNTRLSNENGHHNNYPQPQPLSRSSSRKAEQSPCRRTPMAELDENSLQPEQRHSRKLTQSQTQKPSEGVAQARKPEQRCVGAGEIAKGMKSSKTIANCVREQLMSCRAKEQLMGPEIVEEATDGVEVPFIDAEGLNPRTTTRTRRSRRSSRDLDHLGVDPEVILKPNSYNSLLLEDIHNYHQQNTAFSLPASVSKACVILEAVADLKSSFSDNKCYEGERSKTDTTSRNERLGKRGLAAKEPFMKSEIVVKDDLLEPSLHKYVTVRDLCGEEPQESAGSNSFVGQPWASPWGPNSVDSTDRYWTSQSNDTHEEVAEEELSPMEHQQQHHPVPDARGKRVRGVSGISAIPAGSMSSGKKRELDHRQLHRRGNSGAVGGPGKIGGSAFAVPVAAAAAASS